MLLAVTVLFQLISLATLLRVATGIAATSPPPSTSGTPPPVIVVPSSLNQSVSVPQSTPQFVNPAGGGLGASLLLVVLFIGANLVVIGMLAYLYRKKRMKQFSIIVSIFLIFNVTELYVSFLLGIYSIIPFVAASVASIVTIVAAIRKSPKLINTLALFLALELGSSFPVLLQAPLNWLVPAVYAVFDIYAIYYGRLGRLVKQVGDDARQREDKEKTKPAEESERKANKEKKSWPDFGLLTVNLDKIEIGMADIAFYSMVPAVALILKSLFAFVVVMAAVDAGLVFSFYAFRNKEVAPGLPIPILSGLVALLIVSLI